MTISATQKSLIIIDSRVSDWTSLITELDVPVLVLDSARDGLTQIAEQIGNYSDLAAIHIVSHGSSGGLLLGATLLNQDNLNDYSAELDSLGKALTENADVLLYGCDVAEGDAGLAFIKTLSTLINADVAASNDLTGAVNKGGDWLLEVSTGAIETDSLVNNDAYAEVLAVPVVAFSLTDKNQLITEGDTGTKLITYTVTLSEPSSTEVSVNYSTYNFDAVAGSDYTTAMGALVFAAGETEKSFTVELLADTVYEVNEVFSPALSNPIGAVLGSSRANTTIINDDVSALPFMTLSSLPSSITEGNTGTKLITLTATLSFAASSPVTVDYNTSNKTATAGSDYITTNGRLTFAIGETSKTFTVEILSDTTYEVDESFYVGLSNLSGAIFNNLASGTGRYVTITNDDVSVLPKVSLSTSNPSITEGNTGSQLMTFTATLSAAATSTVTIDYATNDIYGRSNNVARSVDGDYVSTYGTLTFAAGETSKTFTVEILADTVYENNEIFFVHLKNPSSGLVLDNNYEIFATITNDDSPLLPVVSVSPSNSSIIEGNTGSKVATFTVSLSAAASSEIAVNYLTMDRSNDYYTANSGEIFNTAIGGLTALSGSDYKGTGGTLIFAAGETSKTITVELLADTINENDEIFFINLSNPIGAVLSNSNSYASITLLNDDSGTINNPPTGTATATLTNGTEDTAYTIKATDLLQGFSDVDGDSLSVTSLTANHGTLTDNNNGTWTFNPTKDYNGTVTLNYSVVDGKGGSVNANQGFTLSAVNDAPTGTATANLANGIENTTYIVKANDLLQGFNDVDGDILTVTGLTADQGSLVDNNNGTWTLSPTNNYIGTVHLNYNVIDGNGGSIVANQSIDFVTMPEAPTLAEPSNITLIDTVYDDTFNTITGTLSTINNTGTVLTYGIKDGIDNKNGTVSKHCVYGTLTVHKSTGAYQFEVTDKAVEVLMMNANANFTVTVTDSSASGDSKPLTINVVQNGVTESNGNNTFQGTLGTDKWAGLLGHDTYYVNNTEDSITEKANEGYDIVYSSVSYTLSPNIEVLRLTGNAAINGTGNADNNSLQGNTANNILTGGEGLDTLTGGIGKDTYHLAETTAATDTVIIGAGESLATANSFDSVHGFKLGSNTLSTTGVDKLDLQTTLIAANVNNANGIDAGTVHTHSIQNGMITFDTAITASNLNDVMNYLKTNITGGNTVALISEGNTYVFQDNGVMDTLVELVGVSATSLSTTGLATGAVWLV